MRYKAYKYRFYPSEQQAILLRKHFGCSRFVYNWALEQKNAAYQKDQPINCTALIYRIPELRKSFLFLKEVNSQSLQQAICNLDTAFVRFFQGTSNFPAFKKKDISRASFVVPQHFRVDLESGKIIIPKFLEGIPCVFHRQFEGTPKSVTVSMSKSGKFFASVLVEQDIDDPRPKPVDPKTTIGIDMGLKSFLVVSDGRKIDAPRFARRLESKIGFLDRQMRKKVKGSKRREKARIRLARKYEKVANRRTDFLHKASSMIADESQVGTICVETLNVAGMLKNHSLARSIQDAAWSEFIRQSEYKCRWRGINHVKIGRFEASSRLCPCGFRNDTLTLKDRTWTCPRCGRFHDRDSLAANNIKIFGIQRAKVLEAWSGNLEQRQGMPLKVRGAAGTGRFKTSKRITTGAMNRENKTL